MADPWKGEERDWRGRWTDAMGDKFAAKLVKSLGGGKNDDARRAIRRGSGGALDTKAMHTDKAGRYTPEREELHKAIIAKHFEGSSPQANPRVIFTAGGAASGKSALAGQASDPSRNLPTPKGAVYVNPDDIKAMLPEYNSLHDMGRDDIRAEATHEESSDIAKAITALALQQKRHIIVDGVGNTEGQKFGNKVRAASQLGYRTEVRYAHIPVEEALRREQKRSERTGRKVDEEVLRNAHMHVSRNYVDDIRNIPDVHIKVYSTAGRGQPALIAEKQRGRGVKVINRVQYNEHINKARAEVRMAA